MWYENKKEIRHVETWALRFWQPDRRACSGADYKRGDCKSDLVAGKSSGESVGSLCQIYEIQGMKKRHKKIRRAASDVKFKHFQVQFSDFLPFIIIEKQTLQDSFILTVNNVYYHIILQAVRIDFDCFDHNCLNFAHFNISSWTNMSRGLFHFRYFWFKHEWLLIKHQIMLNVRHFSKTILKFKRERTEYEGLFYTWRFKLVKKQDASF